MPNVVPQVVNKNQIQLDFKTPFNPEICVFSVFVYQTSFKSNCLASCQIKVHALSSFFATVRTGIRKPINIPIFGTRKQQSIMVYTDEPDVAKEVTQRPIQVENGKSTNVQLTVKT